MKKLLSMLAILGLVLSFSVPILSASPNGYTNGLEQMVSGELIVSIETSNSDGYSIMSEESIVDGHISAINKDDFTFKDSLLDSVKDDANEIGAFSAGNGLKSDVVEKMGYVYLVQYDKKYKSQTSAANALKKSLAKSGVKVKYVEPNYQYKALGNAASYVDATAVHSSQKWHYDMIKAPDAWTITTGGAKVAILDSGIDYNHPSLSSFIDRANSRNFTTAATTDYMDRHGHGTHVGGTVLSTGSVSGVMQTGSLVAVKVLGDNGKGDLFGIQQGVLHAANVGASVINMSLGGGGYSQGFADACSTAISRGVIVIAATGNDGVGSISYPAAYQGVIAVGSVDSNRSKSYFSNYGSGLDLVAPGSNIYSTAPGGRYQLMSGTSMATPHVAGVAGLMRSANPSLSVSEARNILTRTAVNAGSALYYGAGIVNAHAAVVAAGGGGTTPDPIQTVATPSISPAGGSYTSAQFVSISCSTAGATIRYTTNGTEPTASSAVYSSALSVTASATIKAKAFKAGLNDSATATAVFTIGTPGGDPGGNDRGTPNGAPGNPALSHNNWDGRASYDISFSIWWGNNATSYKLYENDVVISQGSLEANSPGSQTKSFSIASRANGTYSYKIELANAFGKTMSSVVSVRVTNGSSTPTPDPDPDPIQSVATPVFSLASGTYNSAQTVSINCATSGATIRYTTNGSEPTASSSVYSGALLITSTTTLKAKAFKAGLNDSSTTTATYTIQSGGGDPGVKVWAAYTNYAAGDLVSYGGRNYQCRMAHTAFPGWEPTNTPALWLAR